ncbi:MAG: hypothetical protein AB8G17_08040 [Gammaproteobacteria bacterium]
MKMVNGLVTLVLALGASQARAGELLPPAEDAALVQAHCSGCHSLRLVVQQCASAEQWLTMIRWMQAKHNLWTFPPETEARIVAYLSTHFGPRETQRRPPLPDDQLPRNPYAPSD